VNVGGNDWDQDMSRHSPAMRNSNPNLILHQIHYKKYDTSTCINSYLNSSVGELFPLSYGFQNT
jgi:hypothetical protein